jgi:hypothetical protein
MSRYHDSNASYGMAYGKGYAYGVFLQVWKIPEDEDNRKALELFGPDGEDMVVDSDSMFNMLTIKEATRLAAKYGFKLIPSRMR